MIQTGAGAAAPNSPPPAAPAAGAGAAPKSPPPAAGAGAAPKRPPAAETRATGALNTGRAPARKDAAAALLHASTAAATVAATAAATAAAAAAAADVGLAQSAAPAVVYDTEDYF